MGSNDLYSNALGTSADATAAAPMVVTGAAAAKLNELLAEESDSNLKLRIFVTGGGCSGLKYGFSFDANSDDGDIAVQKDGVTVVVDSMSFQYLDGAEIDY